MPQWNQHRYCIGEINHVNTFLTNHKRTQRITAKRRVLEPLEAFEPSSHSDKSRSQFETKKKLILYKRELVRETRLAKENIVRAAPHFLRLCIGMVKRLSCWFKNVSALSRQWQKIVARRANSTNKFNKLSRAKEHSSHFYSQSETQITRKEKELELKSWYFSFFETENSSFAETIAVRHSQDCAYKDK